MFQIDKNSNIVLHKSTTINYDHFRNFEGTYVLYNTHSRSEVLVNANEVKQNMMKIQYLSNKIMKTTTIMEGGRPERIILNT